MPDRPQPSAADLLAAWERDGLIPPEARPALTAELLRDRGEAGLPLHLKILVGIGAVLAALCFIGFLFAAGLVDFEARAALIVWGLLFIGLGLLLGRPRPAGGLVRDSFVQQSAFCVVALGKLLFVMGAAQLLEGREGWGIALAALAVTAATWPLYRLSLDRFLSAFATLVAFQLNIVLDGGPATAPMLDLFVGVQLVVGAVLLTHARVGRDWLPLAYALAAALGWTVLFLAAQAEFGRFGYRFVLSLTVIDGLLTAGLLALIVWAAGGFRHMAREPVAVAGLGALALGGVSAPGLILAIGLMILGHARHDRPLLVGGGLLLPVFLWLYYYNIDVDLLTKAGLLAASGAVLLAGWGYVSLRLLPRRGRP